MDYRELLKKYIQHVQANEGTTFIEDRYREKYLEFPKFTNEEWTALTALDTEVWKA